MVPPLPETLTALTSLRPKQRLAALATVLIVLLLFVPSGGAASRASDYACGPDWTSNYTCVSSTGYQGQSVWGSWGPGHNCVSYAAYRLQQKGSPQPWPSPIGNAVDWKVKAKNAGLVVDGTPKVGAIAWWGSEVAQGSGHVAYVESVSASGTNIVVSEDSFISTTSGYDDQRRLTSGGAEWPDRFIHFNIDTTPPTKPGSLQVTTPTTNARATLSWSPSTDSGGKGIKSYQLFHDGTLVTSVGPATTSYTFTSLDCKVVHAFSVSAVDVALNESAQASVANVVLAPCVRARAMDKIVTVQGTGTAYVYDSGGLHWIPDKNTYFCEFDRPRAVFAVSTQQIADQLGSGKPWQPECLSLKRVVGRTVRERTSGAASYVVTADGTAYGSWHWIPDGGTYNCLVGMFPRLDADWTEINSLRGANREHEGAQADCPPTAPTGLAATGSTQTSVTVSWNAGTSNDSYTLYLNGSPYASVPGSQRSYTFTNLGCSASYTLGVRATNSFGLNSSVASVGGGTAACYTLSIGFGGGGAGNVTTSSGLDCSSSCSAQYVASVITLTQSAGSQSGFWEWSGACSGQGVTCTVALNGDVWVGATFVPTWTIQSTANGKYVSTEVGYGGGDYALLRARSGGVGTWEKYVINGNCGGGCSFQSLENHLFVSAELGYGGNSYGELRARSGGWGGWESFTMVGNCASICALRNNINGLYVSAELLDPGGYYARLRARSGSWSGSSGAWESLRIVRG